MSDIATVWTWQAFAAAIVFGLVFGYFVVGGRWRRPEIKSRSYAFSVGVLLAAFVMGLALSQIIAALWTGDADWVRIVSRAFIQIAAAIGAGVGVGLKLR